MSRSTRRTSRFLVAILIAATAAGGFFGVKQFLAGRPGTPLVVEKIEPSKVPPAPIAEPKSAAKVATPALLSANMGPATKPAEAPKADAPKAEPVRPDPPVAPVQPLSGHPLEDAKSRFDGGDAMVARKILCDALAAGQIGAAELSAARELAGKIGRQTILGPRIFKDDPHAFAYTVQPGDRLQKVATTNNVTWELVCRVNGIQDARKVRALQTIKMVKGPFHAVITKKTFTMDLYLGAPGGSGSVLVVSFPVGLGKDDSTPAGTWQVALHGKLKNPTYYSPRGEGIIAADDPKNPLGEHWIGLVGTDGQAVGKASYGIHGTVDPDSIGKEASMGCIRMRNEDVAMVYELLFEGKSLVVVKDQ